MLHRCWIIYENAIVEYGKIFTANLIKCFEEEKENGNETYLYHNIKYVLDSIKRDSSQRRIIIDAEPTDLKNVSIITEMFLLIKEVYHRWISCDLSTSIKVLDYILDKKLKIANNLGFALPKTCILYRGRVAETQLNKADLFHIPFMQAYKIRNQRFSITGQPILYLTNSLYGIFNELSTHEKDEYEKLYITQYRLKPDTAAWFDKIFDLTINAEDLEQAIDLDEFVSVFYKFILSCVCSFPNTRGRNRSFFVEEYVLPQLVTQLLKKFGFKGVRYNTVNYIWNDTDGSQNNEYINYAFFTQKDSANDSIDINLRSKFIIDSPITVLEVDDYSTLSNYSECDIIDKINNHFSRINDLMLIMNQIEGSSYYDYYNDEKDYFFKDGRYRYIDIKTINESSDDDR